MKTNLFISELFESIQGEGVYIGVPAIFLRFGKCTLNCSFCDTKSIWKQYKEYTIDHLLDLFFEKGWVEKLSRGYHLVITGGSPLLQQTQVIEFLEQFHYKYNFLPFVEIENESVLMPSNRLIRLTSCWNNSPKLSNSGMPIHVRLKNGILRLLSELDNSWFKFVVSQNNPKEQVKEVQIMLEKGLIKENQIILMPEASTKEQLLESTFLVRDLARKFGWRFSTRLQLVIDVK